MAKQNQVVERTAAVVEFLCSGEIEEWRSVREVAKGAGLPVASCHGLLENLAALNWVDKDEKGYRIGSMHLIGMLMGIQEFYEARLRACGGADRLKKSGEAA